VEKYYINLVDAHLIIQKEEVEFVIDKDINILVDWPYVFASPAYVESQLPYDYQKLIHERIVDMPAALIIKYVAQYLERQ